MLTKRKKFAQLSSRSNKIRSEIGNKYREKLESIYLGKKSANYGKRIEYQDLKTKETITF